MKPKIEQIENLARLHRQTTGNEVDITMLTTKWEDMTILLRSHDQIAKEQLEQLKASLKERVKLFTRARCYLTNHAMTCTIRGECFSDE